MRTFAPLILVAAIFLYFWNHDRHDARARMTLSAVCVAIGLIYLVWRGVATVFVPDEPFDIAHIWVLFVYLVEILTFVEITVFFLIMSRVSHRSDEADRLAHWRTGWWPTVDVFIPTYNEPIDVLEKTILGAKSIDYPKATIYVLDDGKREWLRQYCQQHGVEYITRPDNQHAKAGNINHALSQSQGEFICIFDADFVPYRKFISRTVGLFADQTVGIVQTPQHFYNRDPIQINLHIPDDFPDEQRLFFDEMAASRDAWGAAFCCGSCSIMRRKALDAVGGIPTESITEDLLTSLVMLRKGYRTIYLNEKLSIGLAAESIEGFFVQRARWARGAIQSLYLTSGPLGPGLTPLQRVLFFPIGWIVQYLARLMALIIPIVYFWFGFVPLYFTSMDQLIFFQGPMLLSYFLAMRWLVHGKYMPMVSTAAGIFASFRLFPEILTSLVKPFGTPFRVTPKGSESAPGKRADYFTFAMISIAMMLTILGLLRNIVPEYAVIAFDQFFPVAVFWALVNIVALIVAGLICFEGKRRRVVERFRVNEPVTIQMDGHEQPAELIDVSVNGCALQASSHITLDTAPYLSVEIPEAGHIAIKPLRIHHGVIHGRFEFEDNAQRDRLITKIFSGEYDNAIHRIESTGRVLTLLWRRLTQ